MKEHTIYISKPIEYWVLEILVVKSHTVAIFFYVAKNGFSHLLVSSSPLAWRLILITLILAMTISCFGFVTLLRYLSTFNPQRNFSAIRTSVGAGEMITPA